MPRRKRRRGEWLPLLINVFRSGERVFLDTITKTDVERALQVKVHIVKSSGYDLVQAVFRPDAAPEPHGEAGRPGLPGAEYGYRGYEPGDEEKHGAYGV